MKILVVLLMIVNLFAFNSIYIWSKEFNMVDNNSIVSFLKQKNINIALVSASKKTNFYKLYTFIDESKLKIEFLIGDNSWIYENKRDKISKKLKFLTQFDNFYIHLDVEPQALKDLKHNRIKYFNMYLNMLKYIKNKFPKYHISISIAPFYSTEYVKQFSKYVDKIYLMAYKYKKLSQLKKRIEKFSFLKSKLVIAFNCKDYTSKQKLLNDIEFIKSLGYENIAFHSFKTLKGLYEIK